MKELGRTKDEETESIENPERKIAKGARELFESLKAKEFSKSGIYMFAKMTIEECEPSEESRL